MSQLKADKHRLQLNAQMPLSENKLENDKINRLSTVDVDLFSMSNSLIQKNDEKTFQKKRSLVILKGRYEEGIQNFNHYDAWFPYLVFSIHKFVT